MKNFRKHTEHLYTVKNQNGLKNAIFDYFNMEDDNLRSTFRTKSDVKAMIQDVPPYFPISFVIVDLSFECNRLFLEFFDINEASHETGWL